MKPEFLMIVQSTVAFFPEECAQIATVLTAANVVEAKSRNPIITTTCKIIQLIPSAIYLGLRVSGDEKIIDPIVTVSSPALLVGVSFLALPIGFKILQKVAENRKWTHIERILGVSEKIFMTAIKVGHTAFIALGVLVFLTVPSPLVKAAAIGLLGLHVWATVKGALAIARPAPSLGT
jgi:hypothetical protein